jgi:thioredoxin reductase (NADPH)
VFSRPSQPVLLAVDDAAKTLDKIERELRNRYGDDYHVVCESSAEAGMRRLRELKATGEKVAVVLADLWMTGMTGMEFLARARQLYPAAKRALLIEWGDRTTQEPILQAMSLVDRLLREQALGIARRAVPQGHRRIPL